MTTNWPSNLADPHRVPVDFHGDEALARRFAEALRADDLAVEASLTVRARVNVSGLARLYDGEGDEQPDAHAAVEEVRAQLIRSMPPALRDLVLVTVRVNHPGP